MIHSKPSSLSISGVAKFMLCKIAPITAASLLAASAFANCPPASEIKTSYIGKRLDWDPSKGMPRPPFNWITEFVKRSKNPTNQQWQLEWTSPVQTYDNKSLELTSINLKFTHIETNEENTYKEITYLNNAVCEYNVVKAKDDKNVYPPLYLKNTASARITIDGYYLNIGEVEAPHRATFQKSDALTWKCDKNLPKGAGGDINTECGGFNFNEKIHFNAFWKDAWNNCWNIYSQCSGAGGKSYLSQMEAKENTPVDRTIYHNRIVQTGPEYIKAKPYCTDGEGKLDLTCAKEIEAMNKVILGDSDSITNPDQGMANYTEVKWRGTNWIGKDACTVRDEKTGNCTTFVDYGNRDTVNGLTKPWPDVSPFTPKLQTLGK